MLTALDILMLIGLGILKFAILGFATWVLTLLT
jgi:hypothetical protein